MSENLAHHFFKRSKKTAAKLLLSTLCASIITVIATTQNVYAQTTDVTTPYADWQDVPAVADPLMDNLAIPADATTRGMWSQSYDWPLNSIHATLLPNGQVLTFGTLFDNGAAQDGRYYGIWNPSRGMDAAAHLRTQAPDDVNSFCSASGWLRDGTLLISGGNGDANDGRTSGIFSTTNFSTKTDAARLNAERWYGTMIDLNDGRNLMIGGTIPYSDPIASYTPEIYEDGQWRSLFGASDINLMGADELDGTPSVRTWWYPRAWVAPNGKVFTLSAKYMFEIDPDANNDSGSVEELGIFKRVQDITGNSHPNVGFTSTAVMYEPGKILQVGGNGVTDNNPILASKEASIIDINGPTPVVTNVPDMANRRHWANSIVLPDGKVAITGGTTIGWNPENAVHPVEIWDPATNTWTTGASDVETRSYHSTTILLPNGTILSSGGGAPGAVNNLNSEIYYPPYLFQNVNGQTQLAQKPTLTKISNTTLTHGELLGVEMANTGTVSRVVLIKTSSTTHSFNTGQRSVPVTFSQNGNLLDIDIPVDENVLPHGYYMLFVLDNNDVPSSGKIVSLGGFPVPSLPPADAITCATEGATCSIPPGQTATVWYGAEASFNKQTNVTGAIACNNDVFGDPAPNSAKTCVYKITNTSAGNDAPTVSITAPVANSEYTQGDVISITATATDSDGTVASVDFYDGDNLLGSDTTSPYTLNWATTTANEAGAHTLSVVATDNDGAVANATTTVTVMASSEPPIAGYPEGVVSAWEFDEGTGATVADGSDNGSPLTTQNITWVEGQEGQAAQFNGYNSVATVNESLVDTADSFTVSAWVKLNRLNGRHTFVSQDGRTNSGFELQYSQYENNKFVFEMKSADSWFNTSYKAVSTTSPVANEWYHLTAVRDAAEDTMKLYVNGELEGTTNYAGGWNSNGPFTIGRGKYFYSSNWANAAIDGVAVFESPLNDEQITSLYEGVVTPPPPPPEDLSGFVTPIVNAGDTIDFDLTGGSGKLYSWNFGDGTTATAFNADPDISHSYTEPGIYTITLNVQDAGVLMTSIVSTQTVATATTAQMPSHSTPIAVEANGRIWSVNPDNDSVSVLDGTTNALAAEIPVGDSPRTLAFAPNGNVWVTNKASATISVISATGLNVIDTYNLKRASQPHGMAFAPNGTSAYVVLEATGELVKLSATTGAQQDLVNVGANARHVAITAGSDTVLVSRFITPPLPGESTLDVDTSTQGGEVLVVAANNMTVTHTIMLEHSDKFDSEAQGSGVPNYLAAPVISPDGLSAWVPSKQDNITRGSERSSLPLDFQNTVRAISSRINMEALEEDYAARIDHDNSSLGSAAAYHPSGAFVFVALETSRQVAVLNPFTNRQLFRIEVGFAPQGVAVSGDGNSLYVQNFMDRTVSIIDLTDMTTNGMLDANVTATTSTVTNEKLSPQVLAGKKLFYDAKDDRLARDDYMSCASCHNDAGSDGRVWDLTGFGEGLRNTIALKGRASTGHGFLHWTANFDELQDFEGQIRALAGGTGLLTNAQFNAGTTSEPLGDAKAGLSTDLDALAAYVASLNEFAPSPNRNPDGTLTTAAEEGKTVFADNCTSCHGGTQFSNSGGEIDLKDIGTITPGSGQRLGDIIEGIDIPTLRDVWKTAPYLHEGGSPTIQSAVEAHSIPLTQTELSNVVAYVEQIGSEETAAPEATAPPDGPVLPDEPVTPEEPEPLTPALTLNQPVGNTGNTAGTMTAVAENIDTINRVEFYSGDNLLATDNEAPYIFGWDNAPDGTYLLSARAYDDEGEITTSNTVTLTIDSNLTQNNIAPTVTLNNPVGQNPGNTIGSVTAIAADTDGRIARVEFYIGGNLFGAAEEAPFTFGWNGAPNGTYNISAKAYDNDGATTDSNNVTVIINSNLN